MSDKQTEKCSHVMVLVRSKNSRGYLPLHDSDLPMFRHFCVGFIEVRDIHDYAEVFKAHGWRFKIEEETAEEKGTEA